MERRAAAGDEQSREGNGQRGANEMHQRWLVKGIVVVTILASATGCSRAAPREAATAGQAQATVLPGIDVLVTDSLRLIRGKRIALLTN